MARLINTIETDGGVRLNVSTIESYVQTIKDEQHPVTMITTISGRKYKYLGTIEMLEENLK